GGEAGRVVVEIHPDEVAALGPRPCRAFGRLPVERLEHRVTAYAQQPVHALDIRLEVAAAEELEHRRLGHERRRDVRRHGERLDLRGERRRHDVVTDPYAWGDRLRERRRVYDVLAALELEQRRQLRALEADET